MIRPNFKGNIASGNSLFIECGPSFVLNNSPLAEYDTIRIRRICTLTNGTYPLSTIQFIKYYTHSERARKSQSQCDIGFETLRRQVEIIFPETTIYGPEPSELTLSTKDIDMFVIPDNYSCWKTDKFLASFKLKEEEEEEEGDATTSASDKALSLKLALA